MKTADTCLTQLSQRSEVKVSVSVPDLQLVVMETGLDVDGEEGGKKESRSQMNKNVGLPPNKETKEGLRK